jgi:endo-1,4-beta-xylanase
MIKSILILAAQSVAVLAAPAAAADDAPVMIQSRQWGGGSYTFSDWHEGNIQYSCQNGQGGSYTVNWSGTGGFVCGKGWSPGGER